MSEQKLRIASYYDGDVVKRNDGPPLYMTYALRKLGHEVIHLVPKEDASEYGKFDFHLWVDWGEDALMPLLSYKPFECPKPSAYWASDTHLGFDYRLEKSREFSKVFVAQKRAQKEFKDNGVESTWLPHAVEPDCYKPNETIKKYDVCFVGHLCNDKRIDFLDAMFKAFPNFWYGQRKFEDCGRIFSEAKIVLNTAAVDDINMRVFETLATKSFLLTENIPTLQELFKDGVHLVIYENTQDAIEKAKYYLEHNEERKKIAQAGYDLVAKLHTYENRARTILMEFDKCQ